MSKFGVISYEYEHLEINFCIAFSNATVVNLPLGLFTRAVEVLYGLYSKISLKNSQGRLSHCTETTLPHYYSLPQH